MTALPLARLLGGRYADSHIVAIRGMAALTLGRLRAEAAHNAQRIAGRRARRGMLACQDSFQFLVGMLALLQAGAEIVLPPNTQAGTLSSFSGAVDLLVTDEIRPAVANVLVLEPAGTEPPREPVLPAQTRIDFFTSGSTGEPKRIEKSLAMLEREAMALDEVWGTEVGSARVLGMVSHQHIFGLAFKVMWPLMSGRCFSAPVHYVWETVFAELSAAAVIISSPAHLTRVAGLPHVAATDRPRMIFSAGAPLPGAAAREVMSIFGIAPTEIFGSTETGALAWRGGADESALWQPLPEVEISSSAEGLLRVRSPFTSAPDWCDLADKVDISADGRFRFHGRADRIIKIEGKRVSLPQLERDIADLQWVEEARVVPLPELSCLGAIAVLTAAGHEELARRGKFRFERMLRRALGATQDTATLPRRWRFVDCIPVDGMGKRRNSDLAMLLVAEP
jgi:acyl-coenzyme A synthetase/AMP-(fatty) acid ligase